MNLQVRRRRPKPAPAPAAAPAGSRAKRDGGPKLFCRLPFTEVSVSEDGDVYPNCCPDWVAMPLGNLHRQSWDEVWNGPQAQELRRSMLDGDLRYCDRHWCPHIQSAEQGLADPHVVPFERFERSRLPAEAAVGKVVVAQGPTNVSMNYDSSCNLACPSCRDDVRQVNGPDAERMAQLHQVVEDELLVGAHTVSMTGTGDPFASRFLRSFLAELSPQARPGLRRVYLYTNAIMWTPQMWTRLPGLHDIELAADISIDAATAATYEVVRRPARWEQLQRNLPFIADLPNLGELGVNMTVSRLNFTEVRAFLDLAQELAQRRGDRRTFVEFKRVRRWGAHDSDAAWAALDLDQLAPDELEVLLAQLREVEELRPSLAGSLEVRSNLGDLIAAPR